MTKLLAFQRVGALIAVNLSPSGSVVSVASLKPVTGWWLSVAFLQGNLQVQLVQL